ncbi:MAG TPA: molybdopterin cofactor-binding domain-containing protein [Spirochaetia bacterium]|nr:molybdopterin cofactor-binding domain-containing protein [Spirochaetia bacterium]
MKWNPDSVLNVLGQTSYIDDVAEPRDILQAVIVPSPSAHGRLLRIDTQAAGQKYPGAHFLTAADIPGENQIGNNLPDETLLVDGEWHFCGEPIALVLAPTRSEARRAAALVKLETEELEPVTDPRVAAERGLFILPPRTMRAGDVEKAYARCAHVIEGRVDSGGQEHLYLETQGAIAWPSESGGVRIVSSTQWPTGVQKASARILGVPMNRVEVETTRIGGGFGGKEDQATAWGCLAALGARVTGRPVKIYLNRHEDITYTGKRHPYSSDFKIGLDGEGRILAFEADYYQNSGGVCDLSPAVLARTLFHAVSAYYVPNVRVTGYMCRTNLVPFTAFRGFGAPQGIFVVEAALAKAAEKSGMPVLELQRRNLLKAGDTFHYGMPVEECRTDQSVSRVLENCKWEKLRKEIDSFNRQNRSKKRGAAMLPLCFGISFTKLLMNQTGALVHVYNDGSVTVSTGGVEMGQGLGRKIAIIAAKSLGIPVEWIRVESTRTVTVANTFPTAASSGTDLNGMAAQLACAEIRKRLIAVAAGCHSEAKAGSAAPGLVDYNICDGEVTRSGKPIGLSWNELVARAHSERVDLSAHAFYSTPGLFYDDKLENGSPFAYHVYGAAVVTATADVLRGTFTIDEAYIVHDAGDPIDLLVDMGQTEGGFVQGLGWAVLEDLRFDDEGRLQANTLSTYKVPDIHFVPGMNVEFLTNVPNPKAVLNSKAIGEPPLMYAIAGYFAVLDALKAARPDVEGFYDLPMTPEKALSFLTR